MVDDDPAFATALRERLHQVLATEGRRLSAADLAAASWHERLKEQLALGAMRLGLAVQGRRSWW